MDKLKPVSSFMRFIFLLLFWVTPIVNVAYWASGVHPTWLFEHLELVPHLLLPMPPLSTSTKLIAFLITAVPLGIGMGVLYFFAKLFGLYRDGRIFELENAHCFRNVAILTLVWQVVRTFYDILISYILTDHKAIYVVFNLSQLRIIFIGIILLVIAWIMQEGARMREEQDYTV